MHKCLVIAMLLLSNCLPTKANVTFKCDSILAYKITVVGRNAEGLWYSMRDISETIGCEQSVEIPFESFRLTDFEIEQGGRIGIGCPLLGVHLILNQRIEDSHVYNVKNSNRVRGERYCLEEQIAHAIRPVNYTLISKEERAKIVRTPRDLPKALIGMFGVRPLRDMVELVSQVIPVDQAVVAAIQRDIALRVRGPLDSEDEISLDEAI